VEAGKVIPLATVKELVSRATDQLYTRPNLAEVTAILNSFVEILNWELSNLFLRANGD
jgi:hypothetical protein